MRTLIIIIAFFSCTDCVGQFDKLKGTWVTPAQEVMVIEDTVEFEQDNQLSNSQLKEKKFELFIFGDTLSFQDRYSPGPNYDTSYVDRYDLKILSLTDSFVRVKPVSKFSKEFFRDKAELMFKRQEFSIDDSLKFEKIVFHTTDCFGECNVYHLEVDSSKLFRLQAAVVYDYDGFIPHKRKSKLEGYFTGQLTDTLYRKLTHALQTCNLTTLKMKPDACCDTLPAEFREKPTITIIAYFNGRRKYFKTTYPPSIVHNLIVALYDVCIYGKGTRQKQKFKIEQ